MAHSNKPQREPVRFRTILADPPWEMDQKGRLGASRHYDLMTLERIKAMPVADLAEENSHLYLWVINGGIKEGIEVIERCLWSSRSTESGCVRFGNDCPVICTTSARQAFVFSPNEGINTITVCYYR